MKPNTFEIKVAGKTIAVPSALIDNQTVVVTGKWVKMAVIYDENWLEGDVIKSPKLFIEKLKKTKLNADFFTFSQKLPNTQPIYNYHMEWDNVAAIPITNYSDWEKRLPQVTRKNIRRGIKRGVGAKITEFNDELVNGIVEIHNDTPMRQGVPFAYYGRAFGDVMSDYGTYIEQSEFIGAYFKSELIGIIKLVYLGKIASIMQILSKSQHYDKRPTNILIAKAVEICVAKKLSYLIYGKYTYGNKTDSSLTEFKRRNGFEKILLPRYYIALNFKGRIAQKLKLHLGLLGILPNRAILFLGQLRSKYIRIKLYLLRPTGNVLNFKKKNTTGFKN